MDRKDILDSIQSYLDKFDELHINDFQHGLDRMNILNPYFGFGPVTERMYNNGYGIQSIWLGGGAEHLLARAYPDGYRRGEKEYSTPGMNVRNLEGVLQLVSTLYEDRLKDIDRTRANPKLETMLPEIGKWAARCIAIAGRQYRVSLNVGRRACDGPQDYHALVIEEDGCQLGSIPLRQDRWGKLLYNVQRPLYGSYLSDSEFTPDNWKDKILHALQVAAGTRIRLERLDSPVRNPSVGKNCRGEYFITCEIAGVAQCRKCLSEDDRLDYIRCRDISNGFYLGDKRFELAEKYYKAEIMQALQGQDRSGGMKR